MGWWHVERDMTRRLFTIPSTTYDPDRFTPSDGMVCAVCGAAAPRRVRRAVAKMFPRLWRIVTPHGHFPFCERHGMIAAMRVHHGLPPMEVNDEGDAGSSQGDDAAPSDD